MHLLLFTLLSLLNLAPLHDAGYKGQGITIAVVDCGFYRVDELTDVYPPEQLLGWKDFVGPDSLFFRNEDDMHGAMVLSTMLTLMDDEGEPLGTAPEASYYLIRTEDVAREYAGEMDNLARGIRYADSIGADIITISLGYRQFEDPLEDLSYEDLNGRSAVSQAATEAARHGRLVCVAAGNDGWDTWHWISVPSDADSILTVGAVGQDSVVGAFSSYGPTADGRKKPEVSAWGVACPVYYPSAERIMYSSGTSFATPRIAGMAACLWQAFPQLTAMQLRQLIIESCSDYPAWDPQKGYGIPNAGAIYSHLTALPNIELTDDATTAYFNLQGMRLAAPPAQGCYIEVRGQQAKKIIR